MQGLLSGLERKNCWTIAEHLGHRDPEALQHLLSRAKWDDDGVGDDLLDYVLDAFNDPAGILVIDLCRSRNYTDGGVLSGRDPFSGWASGIGFGACGRHSYSSSRNASSWSQGW